MTQEETVSLREYLEARLDVVERSIQYEHEIGENRAKLVLKSLDDKFITIEKSTSLAANSVDKRLESMNEFRAQLNDQTTRLLTRVEYDSKHDALEKRIGTVETVIANFEGRMWAIGVGMTILSIIIGVVLHFIH